MAETKTAPGGAIQDSQCEDNEISRVVQRVKQYFLQGKRGTAIDINRACLTGDSRKRISDLRKAGWRIQDRAINGLQKLYWLDPAQREEFVNQISKCNE